MKLRAIPVAAALLVVASAFAFVQDATIKWSPKEGETKKFKMVMTSATQMGDMEMEMLLHHKVLAVKEGKITVEEKSSDLKLSMGGQDMTAMLPAEAQESPVVTVTYNVDGDVLERKESKKSEFNNPRMESMMLFTYPKAAVKVGEKWTVKKKADKAKGTHDITATFTYEGSEELDGVKTHKISSQIVESGAESNMTVNGTTWISPETGDPIKSETKLKNFEIPGMGPVDATIKVTLVK